MKNPDRAWIWLAPLLAGLVVAVIWGVSLALNAPPGSPVKIGIEVADAKPGEMQPWSLFIDGKTLLACMAAGLLATIAGLAWLGAHRRRQAAKTPQDRD